MSKVPTLLLEVEEFIYNNAQQLANRRLLLSIVKKWEDAYQARIYELENQPPKETELSRMVDEGGIMSDNKINTSIEEYYDDFTGTRYAGHDDYQD